MRLRRGPSTRRCPQPAEVLHRSPALGAWRFTEPRERNAVAGAVWRCYWRRNLRCHCARFLITHCLTRPGPSAPAITAGYGHLYDRRVFSASTVTPSRVKAEVYVQDPRPTRLWSACCQARRVQFCCAGGAPSLAWNPILIWYQARRIDHYAVLVAGHYVNDGSGAATTRDSWTIVSPVYEQRC